MEEHEIMNAREWQLETDEIHLPFRRSGPHVNIANTEQLPDQSVPKATNAPQTENTPNARVYKAPAPTRGQGRGQSLRGGRSTRGNSGQLSPGFIPVWAKRPATWNLPNKKPTGHVKAAGNHEKDQDSSPVKSVGRVSTESFDLPAPYGVLKETFSNRNKSSVLTDAIKSIEKTGATICQLADSDRNIVIRGTPAQRGLCRDVVRRTISTYNHLDAPGSKRGGFAKITSYFEDKETHIGLLEKQDDIVQSLRQPQSSIKFPQTLLFLWPENELPMKLYLGGSNLEDLDPIRREFHYPIYMYKEAPDFIRIDGYDLHVMRVIVHRLRTKWSELMASVNVKAKLYLVQPPSTDTMRPDVDILKVSQHDGGFAYASVSLHGNSLDEAQRQQWAEKSRQIQLKNDNRLRDSVERSLQGLRFLRGHVRMRVNFGTFVLDAYRNPTGSKPKHSFLDFRHMLLHDKTKGHLIPGLMSGQGEDSLVTKCTNATDLLEPYEATALSLETMEPVYAVNFEFPGKEASMIRLEIEFIRYPGSKQFEVAQRRWVQPQGADRPGDKRAPLQVGVIDFERADWQLEIKALEFNKTSGIDQALEAFAHSVKFRTEAAEGGLKAEARRKVTFSDTAQFSRLIEKSALRYRVKGTGYIFELARYDEYRRLSMEVSQGRVVQPPNQLSKAPATSWGASIFDMHWDNVLGEHANYGVGRSAEWRPNLNTFFPSREGPSSTNFRAGFSDFMDIVTEVSELLHPRLSQDSKSGESKEAIDAKLDAENRPTDKKNGDEKPEDKATWAKILSDPDVSL